MKGAVVVVLVIGACRSPHVASDELACRSPHITPDELELVAYKIVGEDNTPLAYVVYPPYLASPRPPPRFYDLDGYRIFPVHDSVHWKLVLLNAEMDKRTRIVADEFLREDLLEAPRAPPSYIEAHNELEPLRYAFHPEERVEQRRREYKQSCAETLEKILRLAKKGDLAYIPQPFRVEIRKAIDSDDYYELCTAFNAMIALGIVAPADEFERARLSENLDEPWLQLAPRVREALFRYKKSGGTIRTLARPPFRP